MTTEENKTEENKTPAFLKKITPYDKNGTPGQISFLLGNGDTLVIKKEDISPANQEHAFWHGVSQRVGDTCANFSKLRLYGAAMGALAEVKEILASEEWTKGAKGPRPETEQSILDLVQAIATVKGLKESKVDKIVRAAPREQRDQWRKDPAIVPILLELELTRLKTEAESAPIFDFPVE